MWHSLDLQELTIECGKFHPFFEMKTNVSINALDKNKLYIFSTTLLQNKHTIEVNIVYVAPTGQSKTEYSSLLVTLYLP